jgi:hypothetical protein
MQNNEEQPVALSREEEQFAVELIEGLRLAYQQKLLEAHEKYKHLFKQFPHIREKADVLAPNEDPNYKTAWALIPDAFRVLSFVRLGKMSLATDAQKEEALAQPPAQPEQAANTPQKRGIAWAAKGAIKAAKAMTYPETEQSKARLEVCGGCEKWDGKSCKMCGCYTALKVKIPEEKCPLGKW